MKNYLPKNKNDVNAITHLKRLPFEAIRYDVPELLIWFQDLNWRVAYGLAQFLRPHVNKMKDDLIAILNSNDELWKWGVLGGLVEGSSEKIDPELLTIIKRMADKPTEYEKDNDVDTVAKRIIEKNS